MLSPTHPLKIQWVSCKGAYDDGGLPSGGGRPSPHRHPPCDQPVLRTNGVVSPLNPHRLSTPHRNASMTRERDPYRIPRAGWEIAPTAGLAAMDLNGNQIHGTGTEFIGEHTMGGMLVYAIYQALLSGLRTEAIRKRGEIDRATQIRVIGASVWESTRQGAAVSVVLSVVLLVFPWLAFPLSLVGLVGMGKASIDLVHAFWDGLDEDQRSALHRAAYEAGVNLGQLLGGSSGAFVQTA